MKNIRYILISIACIFTAAACSLDEESFTEIEKDKYINDASEANTVLLGIYKNMTYDEMYGYYLSIYFTLPSDIAKITGNELTNWRNVPCNAFTSTEDEIQGAWEYLYNSIYQANDFIEGLAAKMEEFSDNDKKTATAYMGEARALRALFYFELVRWYGHVPLMTKTSQSDQHPSTFVQADPVDVYKFIEQDLLYAIEVLPYATDDTVRSDNSFRISKGGALGLLAKVYATWAGYPLYDETKWEDAAKTAEILVTSGKHGLLSDYEQLWKNSANSVWDPTESLIEVSFYSPIITGNSSNDASGRIGKWNSVPIADGVGNNGRAAGNWRVITTFAKSWKESYPGDKRWDISIADYRYTAASGTTPEYATVSETQDGNKVDIQVRFTDAMANNASDSKRAKFNDNFLYPGKWDMIKYIEPGNEVVDANKSNVNWYILRYSDVLLLYAEAMNEWKKGPTTEAYNAVNMVRRRGFGLPVGATSSTADLPEGLSYEQFQQAVRDERSYELAFEGHRRQDLIRWGIFYDSIQQTFYDLQTWHDMAASYYRCIDFTVKGKNELMPIPQRDMDLCKQFKQNPGW